MDFLQGQIQAKQNGTPQDAVELRESLLVFRIKCETNSLRGKFWEAFSESEHEITTKDGQTLRFLFSSQKTKKINFENVIVPCWDGFFQPHLLISPTGKVGILVFHTMLLGEDNTTNDLKLFNYHLHKIQGDLSECRCINLSTDIIGEEFMSDCFAIS